MGIRSDSNSQNSPSSTLDSLGTNGIANRNNSGIRFLSFIQSENLIALSTYFPKIPKKYITWIHPRSKTGYQIDHIFTHASSFKLFKDVSTGTHLTNSDHWPVVASVEKRFSRKRPPPPNPVSMLKKLDFSQLNDNQTSSISVMR